MTYATQFPTFPAADLPAFVLSEGWTDHSWSKEACPFFIHEATGLGIWTGGSVREPDMGARFVVVQMVASADGWQHGDSEPLYSGDSEAEALDALIMATPRRESDPIANAHRYSDALNAMEIPPNGDDFNAIMDFLDGAAYRAPHVKGR